MRFLIPAGHPPLHFNQFVFYRWIATMGAYFFMSLAYSFVSLAFRIPFSNQPAPGYLPVHNPDAYGQATFVVYWMINFFGMCALGMACENVAMIIGQPWTAMWLIFWVISNVSTSFYALDITPKFYYWGYAWPLHNSEFASLPLLPLPSPLSDLKKSSKPPAKSSSGSTPASASISVFSSPGAPSTAPSSPSAAISCGGRLRRRRRRPRWRRRGSRALGNGRWDFLLGVGGNGKWGKALGVRHGAPLRQGAWCEMDSFGFLLIFPLPLPLTLHPTNVMNSGDD